MVILLYKSVFSSSCASLSLASHVLSAEMTFSESFFSKLGSGYFVFVLCLERSIAPIKHLSHFHHPFYSSDFQLSTLHCGPHGNNSPTNTLLPCAPLSLPLFPFHFNQPTAKTCDDSSKERSAKKRRNWALSDKSDRIGLPPVSFKRDTPVVYVFHCLTGRDPSVQTAKKGDAKRLGCSLLSSMLSGNMLLFVCQLLLFSWPVVHFCRLH